MDQLTATLLSAPVLFFVLGEFGIFVAVADERAP